MLQREVTTSALSRPSEGNFCRPSSVVSLSSHLERLRSRHSTAAKSGLSFKLNAPCVACGVILFSKEFFLHV